MMAGPVPLDRLSQEVLLGVELDFAFQNDVHGFNPLSFFPFFWLYINPEEGLKQSEEP